MKAAVLSEPVLPKVWTEPTFLPGFVDLLTGFLDAFAAAGFLAGAFLGVTLALTGALVFVAAFAFTLAFAGAFATAFFADALGVFVDFTVLFLAVDLLAADDFFAAGAFFGAGAFFTAAFEAAFFAGAFVFAPFFAVFVVFVLDFGVANGFFSLADFCLGFGLFAFEVAVPFLVAAPEIVLDAAADFLAVETAFFDDFLTAGEDLRLAIMVAPRCVNRSISENQRRTLTEWSFRAKRKFMALRLSMRIDRGATITPRQFGYSGLMKKRLFSKRSQSIQAFKAMAVLAQANELAALGQDIIHLEVGQPDFPVPERIKAAGSAAIHKDQTGYTNANGLEDLRRKISTFYADAYGVDVSPRRIVLTSGASGGLSLLMTLLLDPGQGCLITDPGYPSNRHFIEAFSGEPQIIQVGPQSRFQLTGDKVAAAWRKNTAGLLTASPSNPTGNSLSGSDLSDIYNVVQQHQGFLISDEIYQGLEYGESQRASALQYGEDVFVVNSFSKYFGMTGWRLGWVVAPENAVEQLIRIAQNLFICPSVPAQYAALSAFEPEVIQLLDQQRDVLAQRLDFMLRCLPEAGLEIPVAPDGAFYVYARLPESFPDADLFCEMLLQQTGVALTPGSDFGDFETDRYVRISYAQDQSRLEQAVSRIGAFKP